MVSRAFISRTKSKRKRFCSIGIGEVLEHRVLPSSILPTATTTDLDESEYDSGYLETADANDDYSLFAQQTTEQRITKLMQQEQEAGTQENTLSRQNSNLSSLDEGERDSYSEVYYEFGSDPNGGGMMFMMTNNAPTTSGFSNVNVDEDSANTNVSLWNVFDDVEDADNELTYDVMGNTNPGLFSSISINVQTGHLILNYAENAYGSANITVRATDTGDLWVESVLQVTVAPVNDAPVISGFTGEYVGADTWKFYGWVSDVDDSVGGFEVVFSGLHEDTAVVASDGYFEDSAILDPFAYGYVHVITEDPHEAESNQPGYFIGWT